MTYISGLNISRIDLVSQPPDIVQYSNILTEIIYLHQVDSNLENQIVSLSNSLSNITIDLSPIYTELSNQQIDINNNTSSINNLSISSSNYALTLNVNNQILSLNTGISNNTVSILNLENDIDNILVTNSNQQIEINALFFSISNLPPVDLTDIYNNLNHLYQNDSNLNTGISNNLSSINSLSIASSNYAITSVVNNQVLSLNAGISNNLSSINSLSIASSNYALTSVVNNQVLSLNTGISNNTTLIQGNSISLNTGISNNTSSINYLSGLTSNYVTLGTLQTLSNKSMDYNQNTFTNFPTGGNTYTSNNYFENDNPIGSITDYAGSTLPNDFLWCDGSAISRTTYASLFTAIGTTYGVGDGTTTFNLPNLKGRVSAGYDVSNTVLPFSSTLGATGGSVTEFGSNATSLTGAIVTTTATGYSLSTQSNIQPTIILNKIIKYTTSALSTQNAINIQNVYNPYWGRVFMNTGYSNLVNGVWTDMPNMSVAYGNTLNSFNTTTNTYTCPVSGLYRMSLGAEFINGLVTNVCWTGLIKNGTTLEVSMSRSVIQENTTVDLNVSDIIELVQGDTIKLQCMVQGNSTTDVKGAAYSQRGEDMTHFSWQLESANTLVTAGSNIYASMNSNITQTASNLVLFKGSGYELIDGGSIANFSAYNLKSATTSINISSATAPSSNQVLVATSASNAIWTNYSAGSGGIATSLSNLTTVVNIANSSAPSAGQILVATSASNALWSNISNSGSITGIINPYKARVYKATNSAGLATGTWTKVAFANETYDTNNNFDSTTNYRYVAPVAGYYQVNASVTFTTLTANKRYCIAIYKTSGAGPYSTNFNQSGSTTDFISAGISDLVPLAVNDYIEIFAIHEAGVNTPVIYGEATGAYTFLSINLHSVTTPSGTDYSLITAISNPYKAKATPTSISGAFNDNVWTKVTLNTEVYDPNNNFDNVTNYRYTVPVTGYYQINAAVLFATLTANKRYSISIYKNGTAINQSDNQNGTTADFITCAISDNVYLTATDYIEVYVKQNTGANLVIYYSTPYTFFSIGLTSV
jgi:microcystin-dependent protein